jgi:MarR family transcriptional regulator for hemolysin
VIPISSAANAPDSPAAPEKDRDPLAWSSDGVERPDSYARFYTPASIDDLRFRFMRRLVVGARRWRAHVDQRLRRIGQSQARWEALVCIGARGTVTQSQLARLVSVEDPTIARMLSTLEREGHIDRVVGTGDRRRRMVRLSADGEKSLAATQVIVDLLREGVLQDLDQEELAVAMRILDKVLARLEQS